MDKETLSNYGWIVICVLVLAVMLALASPFGTFIAGAIKSTTAGLFNVNQAALGSAGIDVDDMVFENCDHLETEIRNVTDTYTGDTCCKACGAVMSVGQTVRPKVPDGGKYTAADGTVYNPGDEMPEVVTTGDKYTYEDYEYAYNMYSDGQRRWTANESQNGWGVDTWNDNKTSYSDVLNTINGKPITSLYRTYMQCSQLVTAPRIPSTVTNMEKAFYGCSKLTTAPNMSKIEHVDNMKEAFITCKSLKTVTTFPKSVLSARSAFSGCTSLEDVSQITVSGTNVDASSMFRGCTSLKDSGMPTMASGVTNMSCTFSGCSSLVDLSNFCIPDTATNMYEAFKGCTSLKKVPNFANASSVTSLQATFENCTSLADASDFVVPAKVGTLYNTFMGCTALTDSGLSAIPNTVKELHQTFYNCTSLVDLSDYCLPNSIIGMSATFSGCTSLKYIPDLSQCPNLSKMSFAFKNTAIETFEEIPSTVTDLRGTFQGCSLLTGTIRYNGKASSWISNCFADTVKPIILTGTHTDYLTPIAATATNGNVTVQ